MPSDFGVFAPVFKSAHGYLTLLNLSSKDSTAVVRLVRECAASPFSRGDILELLSDLNWRPTLVAAVASIFVAPDPDVLNRMWLRLDSGSWVVPQLVVTLSIVDPEFIARCQSRLEAHCPVENSGLSLLTPIERHSAAGPASGTGRSAKAARSLAWLAGRLSPPPSWLQAVVDSSEHRALVAQDLDASDEITEEWHEQIMSILKSIQP